MQGIYRIINTHNGKAYYGSSKNISGRFSDHRWSLRGNVHKNPHLQSAWNQYGESAFVFEIVEDLDTASDEYLLIREQWYLDNTKCLDREHGYNIKPLSSGRKLAPESIEKLRQSKLGFKHTEQAKLNMSKAQKGLKKPAHAVAAMKAALTGRKQSAETIEKRRQTMLANPPSAEARRKMSEAAYKRWHPNG